MSGSPSLTTLGRAVVIELMGMAGAGAFHTCYCIWNCGGRVERLVYGTSYNAPLGAPVVGCHSVTLRARRP